MPPSNSKPEKKNSQDKLLDASKVLKRYKNAIDQNKLLMGIIVAQIVIIFLLVQEVGDKKITQIVTPPTFTEEISMRGNQVSESYQTGWALYVAELIGNVTPARMDLTVKIIRKMIPQANWKSAKEQMTAQLTRLHTRKIEERFVATDVSIDPVTKLIWVFGEKETTSIRTGQTHTVKWTFEVKIGAHLGAPKILHLRQYEGAPKKKDRIKDYKDELAHEKS